MRGLGLAQSTYSVENTQKYGAEEEQGVFSVCKLKI